MNERKRPPGWSVRRWKNFKYHNAHRRQAGRQERLYMVFREGGDMPTVVHSDYGSAVRAAAILTHRNAEARFHVLESVQVWEAKQAIEARQE